MLILHERFGFGTNSTISDVSIVLHQMFALEDERRETKVPGETCIPPGRYLLKLRIEGGMHERYKARFPGVHRGMLWFQDVPGFTYVYYHVGNRERDTDGCPLTGEIPVMLPDGEFEVARSEKAYLAFYKKVLEAMDAGEEVWVEIKEREPAP